MDACEIVIIACLLTLASYDGYMEYIWNRNMGELILKADKEKNHADYCGNSEAYAF